jgi:hypothetical protein
LSDHGRYCPDCKSLEFTYAPGITKPGEDSEQLAGAKGSEWRYYAGLNLSYKSCDSRDAEGAKQDDRPLVVWTCGECGNEWISPARKRPEEKKFCPRCKGSRGKTRPFKSKAIRDTVKTHKRLRRATDLAIAATKRASSLITPKETEAAAGGPYLPENQGPWDKTAMGKAEIASILEAPFNRAEIEREIRKCNARIDDLHWKKLAIDKELRLVVAGRSAWRERIGHAKDAERAWREAHSDR